MENILPLFELTIDETQEAFVEAIALVESPAIIEKFLMFSKEELIKFNFNDDKMELYGPAMIPNLPIYRKDDNGYEYNVYFNSETIKQIERIYFKKGFQKNINIEHTEVNAGSYVFESLIIDRENGIAPKAFSSIADGSWLVRVKVEDKNIWADIKAGKTTGFSVEGVFQLLKQDFKNDSHINIVDEEVIEELTQNIKYINSLLSNINI